MKKIVISLLIIVTMLSAKPYRINGFKELHRTIKNYIALSTPENLKKLTNEEILISTVQLSSMVVLVDELTDNNYLQNLLSAFESVEEYLSTIEDDKTKTTLLAYIDDLKKDMINQNKSDLAGGTKTYKFDIEDLADDNLPLYEIKPEIKKGGQKTLARYIPVLTKIDADIVTRMNEFKIEEITWNYIINPSKEEIEALLLFKGKKVFFPVLRTMQPEALDQLTKFKGAIEFNKLEVDENILNKLINFQTSELTINGQNSEINNILKEKLGSRYKKSILFKKRKSNKSE